MKFAAVLFLLLLTQCGIQDFQDTASDEASDVQQVVSDTAVEQPVSPTIEENAQTVPDTCEISADVHADFTALAIFEDAFTNQKSNIQVLQEGEIIRILSDDTDGERHQRLIVELDNKQTLLIAHNIDLAPRVPSPEKGTVLRFYGEYEWNDEGGVVHWTHKDPDGDHIDGWLEYKGMRYQ